MMHGDKPTEVTFLILGAGMAGLGAGIQAQRLGQDSLILEEGSKPGGLCQNTTVLGCDFDYGPKILLLDTSENSKDLLSFLDGNYEEYPVVETVYLSAFGLLGFPLQRHLVGLPPDERAKVLKDIEYARRHPRKVESYKDWLLNGYGAYLCENVLIPYEEKKWQTPLDNLDYTWALNRPVKVDIDEVIEGSTRMLPPNRVYYYPKRGNISVLSTAMARQAGPIRFDSKVTHIDLQNRVVTAGGKTFAYKYLISTLPLNYEVTITDPLPRELAEQSREKLQGLSIKIFNLVFEGNFDLEGTAIYFPEKKFIFRRVSVLGNLCPALARDGLTPISVEISVGLNGPILSDEEQLQEILENFQQIPQFAQLGRPVAHEVIAANFAYPLQKTGLRKLVKDLHDYYDQFAVHHCGRGGNFDYCNSDIAYLQGKQAVAAILDNDDRKR